MENKIDPAIELNWGNFFKPEVRSSGLKLFAQEKVSLSGASDTAVTVYVRVAPPFKVVLTAEEISSESFTADCSCPAGKKERFCKHIWATLLCVGQKHPDFLSAKRAIEMPNRPADSASDPAASYAAAAKLRAAEFRKNQYQKMKLRAKEAKREKQGLAPLPHSFPPEVEAALAYFTANGFPMPAGPSEAILGEAKRKLSRVFHPDKGGAHHEIIELNDHCELLTLFLREQTPPDLETLS